MFVDVDDRGWRVLQVWTAACEREREAGASLRRAAWWEAGALEGTRERGQIVRVAFSGGYGERVRKFPVS